MPASSASSTIGISDDQLDARRRQPGSLMQIGRVIGTVVATQKHRKFEGAKLLLVQPLNIDDTPRGTAILAIDGVGAGVDEKVLVVMEGRAAGEALGRKAAPVDAAVIGIIDTVTIHE
jgi:ethanolamine utilization protein EutN